MGVVADDVNPGRIGAGGQHFFVEPAGTLRIHPRGFIQVDWSRDVGVAGGVKVHPLAAANDGQGSFFTHLVLGTGAARVVDRMGRIDELDHRFPVLGRNLTRDEVEEFTRLVRRMVTLLALAPPLMLHILPAVHKQPAQ